MDDGLSTKNRQADAILQDGWLTTLRPEGKSVKEIEIRPAGPILVISRSLPQILQKGRLRE